MKDEKTVTKDIIFQKKRVAARERIGEFKKLRKKAYTASAVFAFILVAALGQVILRFYDLQKPLLSIILILLIALLTFAAYVAVGGKLFDGVGTFMKWRRLYSRWKDAVSAMESAEEKTFNNTVFEGDLLKAEERLEKVCDDIAKLR